MSMTRALNSEERVRKNVRDLIRKEKSRIIEEMKQRAGRNEWALNGDRPFGSEKYQKREGKRREKYDEKLKRALKRVKRSKEKRRARERSGRRGRSGGRGRSRSRSRPTRRRRSRSV